MPRSLETRGRAVFEASVRELHRALVRHARALRRRQIGDGYEAEDIVQEAWLSAWRNIDCFEGETVEEVYSWIRALIRLELFNIARTVNRAKRDRGRLDPSYEGEILKFDDIVAVCPSAEDVLAAKEKMAAVDVAVRELGRRQNRIVVLVVFEGKTVEEARRDLQLGAACAYKRLERGLRRLRRILRRMPAFREDDA